MAATAKLTDDQAWEIYQLAWHTRLPHREIASMYGIAVSTVSNIKSGYTHNFQQPFPRQLLSLPPIAGGAGWSFIKGSSATSNVVGTTGTTLAFGSNITAGNVIIIASLWAQGTLFTPTYSDTQGATWHPAGGTFDATVGANIGIGWAIALSSAADTLKVTWNSGSTTVLDIFIGEFAPPAGTISQDGATTTIAESTNPTVHPVGGGTGSNDLVLNMIGYASSWTSWGGAWASVAGVQDGNMCGYLINAAGNSAPSANQSGTNNIVGMTVALQAGAAAAPPSPPRRTPLGV